MATHAPQRPLTRDEIRAEFEYLTNRRALGATSRYPEEEERRLAEIRSKSKSGEPLYAYFRRKPTARWWHYGRHATPVQRRQGMR